MAEYDCITLAVRASVRQSVHLSYARPSVFSFPNDNLSRYKWIFTVVYAFDIVKTWFGIAYV